MLQASHRTPPLSQEDEQLDTPEAWERLIKRGQEPNTTRIVTIYISEAKARKIVKRLWPDKGLMGATCGRGFSIETAEQAAVVNEVLKPDVSIDFNLEKHEWMLQTWPE